MFTSISEGALQVFPCNAVGMVIRFFLPLTACLPPRRGRNAARALMLDANQVRLYVLRGA
eukprot:SAG22_NODE_15051_length_358_cov_0.996139_1_plen_59_part_10